LDLDELLQMAHATDATKLAEWYRLGIEGVLQTGNLCREPVWSEAIAVGSEDFVRRIAAMTRFRTRLELREWIRTTWYVCDPSVCYGTAKDVGSGMQPRRDGS
jgi:hypothetical protein